MAQSEMIERSEVVGYLKFLASHAMKGMSPDFRERRPEMNDEAIMLLAAGLIAAAQQVEEGKIDLAKWSDRANWPKND